MLSAVRRYKLLVSGALARYFPRTTAYLEAERADAPRLQQPAPRTKKAPATRTGKPKAAKPAKGKPAPGGIYSAGALAMDEEQIAAMRERVRQAVSAKVISAPSEEQWAMILSRDAATRVFAGAGSGKSTTLVLRVVFMLCHLRIDPGSLTVISFTSASCAQLRELLERVLAFWEFPFDAAQARQCVRTFHSAMGVLAREQWGAPRWFEQLDERAGDSEPDNPLTASRLKPAQSAVLRQAYESCYAEQPVFRDAVHRLLGIPPAVEGVPPAKAPLDAYQLPGEFSAAPLFEVFYQQAGFIQSIGIRIDRLDSKALDCSAGERLFIEALLLFWGAFEAQLQARGLMSFDGAFQALTERLPTLQSSAGLEPLRHLLIDEFQDISPQIVLWLQAVHRRLAGEGGSPSLMAIGDDWQSIYGWRGSSPELFMDFDWHFPGRGRSRKSTVLLLQTNYRSIEAVLRDGEAVLADVAIKQAKLSRAVKREQPGDHGVRLESGFDIRRHLPRLIGEIEAQCEHVAAREGADRNAVLVLSRRNQPLRAIQAELDRRLPVKAYSIHRAKGLQAEVAIILDDGASAPAHPLRNALYRHSGFFRNSYDQAMQDESLRLAYVAITRGVSRVIWFTDKPKGAAALLGRRAGRQK
jgi:DNA helicase-4